LAGGGPSVAGAGYGRGRVTGPIQAGRGSEERPIRQPVALSINRFLAPDEQDGVTQMPLSQEDT